MDANAFRLLEIVHLGTPQDDDERAGEVIDDGGDW